MTHLYIQTTIFLSGLGSFTLGGLWITGKSRVLELRASRLRSLVILVGFLQVIVGIVCVWASLHL